jgi:mannose-6-phosphate isomerase-like protein (cupin superfamily)
MPSVNKKPWGTEEIWATTHHSVGKILTIDPGHRLSRKYHRLKTHNIRILEGTLKLEIGPRFEGDTPEVVELTPGMGYHLSARMIHRFCAGDEGVKIIEVSNQGPSDSVRLEDDYRRITDIPTKGLHSDK